MKQKNLVLMVVAVGCGLVAAFLTTQINAKPKVEKLPVWVAVKDLPVGTMLTKAELGKYAVKKDMAKDALPPAFIINEEELYDRRLTRPVLKDETFNPGALTKGGVITLPEGMDMISMPVNVSTAVAGFVGPGSKVDVLATVRIRNEIRAFPLLIDMLVLAVDTHTSYDGTKTGTFANLSNVSFAATQEQALLLALAKQRGCHMELLLRHPGKPVDTSYDIKKVMALLQSDREPARLNKTENPRNPDEEPPYPPSEAPTPKEKEELVKVWVATGPVTAGTEITKDLVASKLKEKEMPRQFAIGAYSDLSECIKQNLTLKVDLKEGQWVTTENVGPSTKASPQDPFTAPKGAVTEAKPRAILDVPVTTVSGTMVHRFEEVAPGVWKLKATMTQEEATRTAPKDHAKGTSVPAPK